MPEAHPQTPPSASIAGIAKAAGNACDLDAILRRAAGTGQEDIIVFLANPANYPHRPDSVEITETHMSLVFFAGEFVFKMKRAVQLKHLDMRRRDIRRMFCQREAELNHELAPGAYLGTAAITRGCGGALEFDGSGTLVEMLVVMQRLDLSQALDQRILQGSITPADMDDLCRLLCAFYRRQPPAGISANSYVALWSKMIERVRSTLTDPQFALDRSLVDPALDLLTNLIARRGAALRQLVTQGCVIDGHGDLKPEHIILGPQLQIIDRIEFDDRLRLSDPFEEVIFLGLECEKLGAKWISRRLIDGLAAGLGTTRPPELLQFYRYYKACMRARLSIEHLLDEAPRTPERWPRQTHDYLRLALDGDLS